MQVAPWCSNRRSIVGRRGARTSVRRGGSTNRTSTTVSTAHRARPTSSVAITDSQPRALLSAVDSGASMSDLFPQLSSRLERNVERYEVQRLLALGLVEHRC